MSLADKGFKIAKLLFVLFTLAGAARADRAPVKTVAQTVISTKAGPVRVHVELTTDRKIYVSSSAHQLDRVRLDSKATTSSSYEILKMIQIDNRIFLIGRDASGKAGDPQFPIELQLTEWPEYIFVALFKSVVGAAAGAGAVVLAKDYYMDSGSIFNYAVAACSMWSASALFKDAVKTVKGRPCRLTNAQGGETAMTMNEEERCSVVELLPDQNGKIVDAYIQCKTRNGYFELVTLKQIVEREKCASRLTGKTSVRD